MEFIALAHFHHGVDSVAVKVSADDRDSAENVVFEAFEFHEDWAIESVEVVREADPVTDADVPTPAHFA